MEISRTIEFDAGHRVARHGSQCANPHGHRYVVTLCVVGAVRDDGSTEHGMVTDFAVLKDFLTEHVHDRFDHGFIVEETDAAMREALKHGDWKHVVIPVTPTAENLAALIGTSAALHFGDMAFDVQAVTVRETPNSSATWTA